MPKGKQNKRYTLEFKQMVIETMQKERLSYSVSDSMDTRLNALSEFQGDRLSASRIFQNPNCPIYRVQFKKTKSPIIIP